LLGPAFNPTDLSVADTEDEALEEKTLKALVISLATACKNDLTEREPQYDEILRELQKQSRQLKQSIDVE
jgi:hypothetical protein